LGNRAVRFVNNLTHTGDFSGEPFRLRPWQADIVRRLFGTVRPDGQRQYRKAFLALPRKQGKTELAAAILLYLLLSSGKKDQRFYSASGDRAQAALIFRAAASMVRNDPTLHRMCTVYDGYKKIVYEDRNSTYEAVSSDAPGKHGLSPSAVLFDEVHVLPNRVLHDNLTTGFAARKEPLTIYITTAGHDRTSLCWDLWEHARNVRDGVIEDPTFLPILFETPPEADWSDEAVWHKAMPALGDFCSLEFIRDEFRKARQMPSFENTFRQLYLNQWTEQASRWLQVERWKECGGFVPAEVDGESCVAGLDLGVTGDMASLCRVFPNEFGGHSATWKYWVPRDGRWKQEQRNRENYPRWEREGWLTFTGDKSTDFDQVERDIVELNESTPFQLLLADRALGSHMLHRLLNTYGIPVQGITQGPIMLTEPMVYLESSILDQKFRHDDNPIAAWNVANATIRRDKTGLMHLDKSGGTQRIDGLAALIDALRGTIAPGDDSDSVYNSEELLIL
jgi:phage terminase large subunit-like protein